MTRVGVWLVVVTWCATACDRRPRPAECRQVVATMRAAKPGEVDDRLRDAKEAVLARCIQDKWSRAAIKCFATATSDDARKACIEKQLTEKQREQFVRAMNELAPEPTEAEMDERLTKLAELKDAMCACRDAACANQVSDDMTRWSMAAVAQTRSPPTQLSAADQERAAAIGSEMATCLQAAMGSGPETDAMRYVAKNGEFKDRLCACTDAKCAKAVAREMTTWSEDFVKQHGDGSSMTPVDHANLDAIERDVQACMRKLGATSK
jgi:hypothetical protein